MSYCLNTSSTKSRVSVKYDTITSFSLFFRQYKAVCRINYILQLFYSRQLSIQSASCSFSNRSFLNKIGWVKSFLIKFIKLSTSTSFNFFFIILSYIVCWSGDNLKNIWYYLFLGRYCSKTSAFLRNENSFILDASSAVLLIAKVLYYLDAFFAIPAKIGFWKTFLNTD